MAPVSYTDLVDATKKKWPVLKEIQYMLHYDKREMKFDHKLLNDSTIKVVEICQGFSYFKGDEALAYANVEEINSTEDDTKFECVSIPEKDVEVVRVELQRRSDVFRRFNASETTMREFISVVLVGAVLFVNKGVDKKDSIEMIAEHEVRGILGRGPVDYDILLDLFHICVAEAKKEKIENGFFQNVAQMVACRDQYVYDNKKRKRDEPGVDYIQDIPSAGIVSTGDGWILLKYFYEDNVWKICRSKEMNIPMSEIDKPDVCISVLKLIMGRIVSLLTNQKDILLQFNKSKKSKTESSA